MQDYLAALERLRKDAALIRDLAMDEAKQVSSIGCTNT
jgi:hypothetical protein